MTVPPSLSPTDLADLPEAVGPEPLVVVRLEGEVPRAALSRAAAGDRLVVGIAAGPLSSAARELARALDLTLTGPGVPAGPECVAVARPEECATALWRAAGRNPLASLVLGRVLRMTEGLPVAAALDAESFAYSTLLGGVEFRGWLRERGPRPAPGVVPDPVLVRRTGDRLRITLNRPDRRNAYGRQVRDALVDALRPALLDPDVAGVDLDGAGPSFCAGGDLAEFGTAPDPVTAHFVRTRGGAGRFIHELAPRIVAHVHGPCVGSGVELAAFAGTVLAAPGTTFRLPEVAMGLIPGAGGTVSIPRRIGRWRTFYLALTGDPLDAGTALAWGLVDAPAQVSR